MAPGRHPFDETTFRIPPGRVGLRRGQARHTPWRDTARHRRPSPSMWIPGAWRAWLAADDHDPEPPSDEVRWHIPWWLVVLASALAVMFGWMAVHDWRYAYGHHQASWTATATVTDSWCWRGCKNGPFVDVRYQDASGVAHDASLVGFEQRLDVGDHLTVAYAPSLPRDEVAVPPAVRHYRHYAILESSGAGAAALLAAGSVAFVLNLRRLDRRDAEAATAATAR